ncbi:PLC-like phosphodiesterase [Chaetomium sp. MPI-SDFR-AT-0129]|nr:PLC-like phosphodiesterase [Chaetomium sp. MPI-SDFR-AT-0129]
MRALALLALLAGSAWQLARGQADDACQASDRTYSTETVPAASHQPYEQLNPVVGGLSTKFYVTVVNLTPHRFHLDSTHAYQMNTFDFGDVPQGRARQNAIQYRGTIDTGDDAGEAYYIVDGTSKTFALRIKSYTSGDRRRVMLDLSGMELGQREYVFPGGETAVSLVITGSDKYGFQASLRHGTGGWMHELYDVIRDRPLRHLIVPGSHDAGMSTISDEITSIGSAANTQTQGVNIYDQLRAGSRWFDLRIASVHENGDAATVRGFWALHVNDETASLAIGNTGESLDDIIANINQFMAENPGEVIFLPLRYLVGRYQFPDNGPIYWDAGLTNTFFAKLRGLNNRCANLDTSGGFQNQPASYFLDRNDGHGCVLPLLNTQHLDASAGVPHDAPGDGIYDLGLAFPTLVDHWSNMMQASDMAPDQIAAWRSGTGTRGADGSSSDSSNFLIAQWIVTPDALASTAYTLQNFALEPTNPSLYSAGVNGIDPEHWPNVVLLDYIGVQKQDQWAWDSLSAEAYTLAIGLNLYMASENCGVATHRSPLLRTASLLTAESRRINGTGVYGGQARKKKQWNGIIFANGTVLDHPPAALHPGKVDMLRAGTVLGNGTVLTESVPNPWV